MSYYLDYKYPFQPDNLQGNITTNQIKDKSSRYGWNYKIDEKDNCIDIKYKLKTFAPNSLSVSLLEYTI